MERLIGTQLNNDDTDSDNFKDGEEFPLRHVSQRDPRVFNDDVFQSSFEVSWDLFGPVLDMPN